MKFLGRWKARQACHGNRQCCQYTDTPQCNGPKDPHLLARWRFRWHQYSPGDEFFVIRACKSHSGRRPHVGRTVGGWRIDWLSIHLSVRRNR